MNLNDLNGTLDHLRLPNVTALDLGSNAFTGGLDFLRFAPKLTTLRVSHVPLSAPLPPTLPLALVELFGQNCNLRGTIPRAYADLPNLRALYLRKNFILMPLPNLNQVSMAENSPLLTESSSWSLWISATTCCRAI